MNPSVALGQSGHHSFWALRKAELRDGHYLLRSNMVAEDPAVLWERYIQLTQIEAAFRTMKSELDIRPIYRQLEHRVEAHILVAFLASCLTVTLKNRLHALAPGLTPKAVLEKLGKEPPQLRFRDLALHVPSAPAHPRKLDRPEVPPVNKSDDRITRTPQRASGFLQRIHLLEGLHLQTSK